MDDLGNFGLWAMVVVVSLVGVLTKLVYFRIGTGGREAVLDHIPSLELERLESIEQRFSQSGSGILLLSSIPGLGSAIAATAGLFRTPLLTFVLLVLISNLVRNSLVVFVIGQGVQLFSGS